MEPLLLEHLPILTPQRFEFVMKVSLGEDLEAELERIRMETCLLCAVPRNLLFGTHSMGPDKAEYWKKYIKSIVV